MSHLGAQHLEHLALAEAAVTVEIHPLDNQYADSIVGRRRRERPVAHARLFHFMAPMFMAHIRTPAPPPLPPLTHTHTASLYSWA